MKKDIADQAVDKRLKILGDDEIEAHYGRPTFTPEEQDLYYSLTPSEELVVAEFGSFKTRAYFILGVFANPPEKA